MRKELGNIFKRRRKFGVTDKVKVLRIGERIGGWSCHFNLGSSVRYLEKHVSAVSCTGPLSATCTSTSG